MNDRAAASLARPADRTADAHVVDLIALLASLPGIEPKAAPGRPPRPAGPGTPDAGWSVPLLVERSPRGMASLELIAAACWELTLGEESGGGGTQLCLRLRAPDLDLGGAEPALRRPVGDRLAALLAGAEPPCQLVRLLRVLRASAADGVGGAVEP